METIPCKYVDLPLEVHHMIFDYLNSSDLFHTFVKLNASFTMILQSYNRIRLNFKFMKKSIFYYLCEHIYPEQIQSIALYDDEYTPCQTKLFISLVPLIRCMNLQSININQISDPNLFHLIMSYLENNRTIQSISINSNYIDLNRRRSCDAAETLVSLTSLRYLTFISSSPLKMLKEPLTKLTHLILHSCAFNDLKIIFHQLPSLIYLDIAVSTNEGGSTFDYIPPSLTYLKMKSTGWTLFDVLEQFLSSFGSLTQLTLDIVGEQHLLNGHRWEALIKEKLPLLKEFNLSITPEMNNLTNDVLTSFQTPFWTDIKHWHMACLISTSIQSCARLFSMPYFCPTTTFYPPDEAFVYYSKAPISFTESCTELKIFYFPSPVHGLLTLRNIETVHLGSQAVNIIDLSNIINLSSVKHVKLNDISEYSIFQDLLERGTNIYKLTIDRRLSTEFMDSIPNDKIFTQIKELYLNDAITHSEMKKICCLFPKLQHITVRLKQADTIFIIFDCLNELISAYLLWGTPLRTNSSKVVDYLNENNICTDGTYSFQKYLLQVWKD